MIDDRKLTVLRAIVTDYVSSREPVGSKALVERHALQVSPATVRNDMAALEDEGYITQPHTSAGRIPTDKGYRLFVDRLGSIKPLSGAERSAITTFLSGAADLDEVLARSVKLLAQLTHQVAIVQYPTSASSTVRHLELLSLTAERVLLVLILSSGRVEQRSFEVPSHNPEQLAALRARLLEQTSGHPLTEAAQRVAGLVEEFAPDDRLLVTQVVAQCIELLAADPSARLVVAGIPNLVRFTDQYEHTMAPMLEALEEQVVLLRLLGETDRGEVTVRIGQENQFEPMHAASLVASGYGDPADAWASLGVVGPTRMDYPATIASVRAVARYLGRYLVQ